MKPSKQENPPPPTITPFTLQPHESTKLHDINPEDNLLEKKECSPKSIEFSVRRIVMTIKTKKGRKNETKNLSKIVKDYTYRFLRGQVTTKVLNEE